jgi:uncharacterized protein with von Willebrand factor type A (vWA) domain
VSDKSQPVPPLPLPALFCEDCGKETAFQRIYTIRQAAHILNKSVSQIQQLTYTGELKARLELIVVLYPYTHQTYHYVYDYFHIDEWIKANLPTRDELVSDSPHQAVRTLARLTKRRVKKKPARRHSGMSPGLFRFVKEYEHAIPK